MRVAALDCGTNSLRLLVADVDRATGQTVEVARRTTIVRLGQDVDREGVFAAAALRRTFAALDDYAGVIGSLDVAATRMVATSAARDVANRDEFLAGARDRLGVTPDIVSGVEEAWLSYDGATRGLREATDVDEPVVVVDIGGGSTEFVMASPAADVRGQSLDVGSVRMTERYLHADPPTPRQVAAVIDAVEVAISTIDLPLDEVRTAVGVAGTVLTMAAMVLDLPAYDRDVVNQAQLPSSAVLDAVDEIVAMSVKQRRALPFMHPDRADVIGAGALVLGCVVRRLGLSELRASSHDILDGIAWSLA